MPSISTLLSLGALASLATAAITDHSHRFARHNRSTLGRKARSLQGLGKRRLVVRQSTGLFPPLDYAAGQISDGVAGDAAARANAVCVDPFAGVDLATVSDDDLSSLKQFRSDAEAAETDLFNPAIDAAGDGEAGDALQRGKISNKVLKLTCISQAIKIDIAQGGGDATKLAEEQTKLNKNIATDVASAGLAQTSVVDGASADTAPATSIAAVATSTTSAQTSAATTTTSSAGSLFPPLSYADGQISDGTAGDAAARANAVCVDPFAGVDLATVSDDDLSNLKQFRSDAEAAETDLFNPAIDAAGDGEAGDALQRGKISNKVLKLTCISQAIKIDIAQGGGDATKLAEEQTKLNKNIATDVASAGLAQTSVVDGGASVATPTTTAAAEASTTASATDSATTTTNEAIAGSAGSSSLFPPLSYADGQISDGVAGDAAARANPVCVDPFAGVDLATVSDEDLTNLKQFRSDAEDAEGTLFNPAIDAAGDGDAADALQRGKISNKVLKLTCFSQALRIDVAKGGDVDRVAKLAESDTKLATNTATDVASAGLAQTAVA